MNDFEQGLDFDESKIRAKLSLILDDLNEMNKEFESLRVARNKALAAGKDTDELDKQINELRDSYRNLTKEVTNTTTNLSKATQENLKARDAQNKLGTSIKENIRNYKVFGVSIADIQEKLRSKHAAIGTVSNALKSNIGFLKLFRIALIGTGIGALLVALGSLVVFLTRSQKGMDAVSRVMAQVGAVTDVLIDQFIKLGEVIFDAFDRSGTSLLEFSKNLALLFVAPSRAIRNFDTQLQETFGSRQEVLRSFGEVLKDQVVNRVIGVTEAISAIGTALLEFRRGNFDAFTESAREAGIAAAQILTGVDGERIEQTLNGISGYANEVGSNLATAAIRAGELEDEFQKIRDEEVALRVARSEANKVLKEQNLITGDITKSEFERLAAGEKALLIEEELFQKETELQQRRLAATEELKSLSISTLEDDKEIAEERIKLNDIQAKSFATQSSQANKLRAIRQEGIARRKAEFEAEQKRIADLEKAYNSLNNTLQDQVQALQLDDLGAQERINAEEEIALKQIQILEDNLKAKADSLDKEFELEKDFQELRQRLQSDFQDERLKAERDEALQVINDREAQLLAEVDLIRVSKNEELTLEQFKEREKEKIILNAMRNRARLLEAELGADSAEVQTLLTQIEVLAREYENLDDERLANIELRKSQQLELVDALTESGDKELELEEFKEKRKTEILIEAALERAEIIKSQFGEGSIEFEIINAQVAKLQNDLGKIGVDEPLGLFGRIKEGILNALDISSEELSQITQSLGSAFGSIVEGLDTLSNSQIAAQDRVIDALDSSIDETKSSLDEQLALREEGVANNSSLLEAQLAEEEALRAAALERKNDLERKAANRTLIIDSLLNISKLTLAASETFAAHASTPFVGIAFAISAIATIFAQIAKVKAQAEEFNTIPQFRLGSAGIKDGMLFSDDGDATHERGGILGRYKDRQGRTRVVEMEEDEAVIPVKQAKANKEFIQKFVRGDYDHLQIHKHLKPKDAKSRQLYNIITTQNARIAKQMNSPEGINQTVNMLNMGPVVDKLDGVRNDLGSVVTRLDNLEKAIKLGPTDQYIPHEDGSVTQITKTPLTTDIVKINKAS